MFVRNICAQTSHNLLCSDILFIVQGLKMDNLRSNSNLEWQYHFSKFQSKIQIYGWYPELVPFNGNKILSV